MNALVEAALPRRLGTDFRWLMGSSWSSNLGDGIALAAGPLLVASLTDDARVVALAAGVQWLPPLLLGLAAGALTDRLDRRRIVITVNLVRVVVLLVLAVLLLTGQAPVVVVLVTLFLLASAEVFADSSAQTFLPMLVSRDDLALANARLQAGFVTVNQLAGPPLGAVLFALGSMWPWTTQALAMALSVVLVSRITLPPHGRERAPRTHLRRDIAEGFRWVRHHAAVRTLVITIFVFNVTFGAAWSVLVLYATERIGLGPIGYGLLTTVGAVGGLVGIATYGWLTRRFSLGNLMRAGLIIEALTHLGLALARTPWVALPIFFVFGLHAFVWGTTSTTIRQRAVPRELQGRVGSVNLVGVFGGLVLGSAIGGMLAEQWGVTAPFWFAFVGSVVFVVLLWGQLRHVAHADDALSIPDAPDDPDAPDGPRADPS